MSSTNFYFGRLNFKHQLTSLKNFDNGDSREERIRRALWKYVNTDEVVWEEQNGNIRWVFGVCIQEDGLILGKFGKVYPDQPTTYDFDLGEFIEEGDEEVQADYSMFLIYPEKNLIIFNQRQYIGYRQFQQAFSSGYEEMLGIDDALTINLLQDAADVESLIDESIIHYIDYNLVPTNPTSDPDMQVLDDHIQGMEADSFSVSAEADGGLNMDDEIMRAGLAMSAAGYGNFEMEYETEDRRETYNSKDRPAKQETDRPERLEDLRAVAQDLIDRARTLLSRNSDE